MPLLRELDKPMDDERAASRAAAARCPRERSRPRGRAARGLPRVARRARPAAHRTARCSRAIQGDLRFRIPSVRFAEAYRRHQPNTFMYLFTYESPAMRGALRACHALEIPFVFGTLDAPFQDRFAGKGAAVTALSRADDGQLARVRPHAAARPFRASATGSPTTPSAAPRWSSTSAASCRTRRYDEERAAWDGIL